MRLNKYLFYGTWILRNTNNEEINTATGINYLIIQDDQIIKLKSYQNYNYLLGLKKSKKASIKKMYEHNENQELSLEFSWITKNTYTYSILGIEIPEIKTNSIDYLKENNITIELFNNNILIANDNTNSIYYIFDLYLGKMKDPNIETRFNTFIFSQIFGIILGIFINKILN